MRRSILFAMTLGSGLVAAVPLAYAQSAEGASDATGQSAAASDAQSAGDTSRSASWQSQGTARDGRDWHGQRSSQGQGNWQTSAPSQGHHDWQGNGGWQHRGGYAQQAGGGWQGVQQRLPGPLTARNPGVAPTAPQNQHLLSTDVNTERHAMANTQRSIMSQRADIRTEAKNIHWDAANMRSTEQNLPALRDQLRTEGQDLRQDERALRMDPASGTDRGDLRYASAAGELRSGPDFRVASSEVGEAAGHGDRAWLARASGQQVWRQMTAATIASNAAATERATQSRLLLQHAWLRYFW